MSWALGRLMLRRRHRLGDVSHATPAERRGRALRHRDRDRRRRWWRGGRPVRSRAPLCVVFDRAGDRLLQLPDSCGQAPPGRQLAEPRLNRVGLLLLGLAVGGAAVALWWTLAWRTLGRRREGRRIRHLTWEGLRERRWRGTPENAEVPGYMPPGDISVPVRPEPRYANVSVTQVRRAWAREEGGRAPMEDLVLGVSIGPLDRDSLVQQPVPFPFQPREDAWLRVLVSSTDFIVGRDLHDLARGASGVEQSLLLPADGSPSLTEDGRPQLRFALRPRVFSTARARISYYYRDALVQSQRLDAYPSVALQQTLVSVVTDYTASAMLDGLEQIPAAPRLSILVNNGPGTTHQLVLRPPAKAVPADHPAVPVSLPTESVGPLISKLRAGLTQMVSSSRMRRKRDLVQDLRRLAPVGLELHRKLFQQAPEVLGPLIRPAPRPLLSITRPRNVTFTIPWTCLYQIGLPTDVPIERVDVCPLVTDSCSSSGSHWSPRSRQPGSRSSPSATFLAWFTAHQRTCMGLSSRNRCSPADFGPIGAVTGHGVVSPPGLRRSRGCVMVRC